MPTRCEATSDSRVTTSVLVARVAATNVIRQDLVVGCRPERIPMAEAALRRNHFRSMAADWTALAAVNQSSVTKTQPAVVLSIEEQTSRQSTSPSKKALKKTLVKKRVHETSFRTKVLTMKTRVATPAHGLVAHSSRSEIPAAATSV